MGETQEKGPEIALNDEETNLVHRLIIEKWPNLFHFEHTPETPDEWTAKRIVRKIIRTTITNDDEE